MGIRFRCPQGHSLHVKSFLAGKKGVCPDCGARVRIPFESTILKDGSPVPIDAKPTGDDEEAHEIPPETPAMKSGEDLKDAAPVPRGAAPPQTGTPVNMPAAGSVPMGSAVTGHPVSPGMATTVPATPLPMGSTTGVTAVPVGGTTGAVAHSVTAVPTATAVPVAGTVRPVASVATPVGVAPAPTPRPSMAPGGPIPPGLVDPISDAPHAVWYVRPTQGGQYGPARGDVFRQWIGQGRVAGDSLLWREGWADWKAACDVFPELRASSNYLGPSGAGGNDSKAALTTARYNSRRQNSTMVGVGMLVMMGLVCVALVVALIFVLSK